MKQNKEKICNDGKQRHVESFSISTPIGDLILKACCQGLHLIYQVDEITDDNFKPVPEQAIKLLSKPPLNQEVDNILKASMEWLNLYFFEPSKMQLISPPHFCTLQEEKFHEHVWSTLAKNVGFGKIVSYKELAALTRSPGAIQSVGSAMKNNPFQLMVPCHRVINSGLKLGAYSGGRRNKTKEWLLIHEGFKVCNGVVSKESVFSSGVCKQR